MKKILLITEGSPTIGLGHAKRTIELAQILKINNATNILINKDYPVKSDLVKAGCEIYYYDGIDSMLNVINKTIDIIIIDLNITSLGLLDGIKSINENVFVVALDFFC